MQRADLRQPELLVLDAARVDFFPDFRVELALHAASTVAWCWPRCTRHVAIRAKLAMELKRNLAASCMASPSYLSATSWMRPTLGAEMNSSSETHCSILARRR